MSAGLEEMTREELIEEIKHLRSNVKPARSNPKNWQREQIGLGVLRCPLPTSKGWGALMPRNLPTPALPSLKPNSEIIHRSGCVERIFQIAERVGKPVNTTVIDWERDLILVEW